MDCKGQPGGTASGAGPPASLCQGYCSEGLPNPRFGYAVKVVLDTASIAVEAEQFAPRKRRRSGALEPDLADDEGEGEDEEEEEDDEDLMLDWRAKRL